MKYTSGLILLSIFVCSCGELSYKRGGTDRELASTRKTCQTEQLKTDSEINECLERNGWKVHKLSDMDLFATASVTSNQQIVVNPENEESSSFAEEKIAESSPSKNSLGSEELPTPKENPKSKIERSNPLDIYSISSWWKMGGNGARNEADMLKCELELGEAHKPDKKNQKYTLGMIVCMHKKGWKALKK